MSKIQQLQKIFKTKMKIAKLFSEKAVNNGTCCWKSFQSQKRKKIPWTAASMCLLTLDQTEDSRSENSTNHISSPWLPSCHSTKSIPIKNKYIISIYQSKVL